MPKKIKFLSQQDIHKCLDMKSTIDAMKIAFSELSNNNVNSPIRTNMQLESIDSGALFMPVYFPAKQLVGLKSVMIHKNNPIKKLPMIHAMYNVFNSETGEPLAVMDGEFLTSMRTGAASGLATDLLSVEDAELAVIFGAGVQAEKQVEAICTVRDLKKIYISDLDNDRIQKLINNLKSKIDSEILKLENKDLIKDADIICTATSSSTPVFDSLDPDSNVHINGIGSYRPDMSEIPADVIISSKLYVDSREACLAEAGDIIQPIEKGKISEGHIYAELGEVIEKRKESREKQDKITVFKSVGNAVQDIATASVILEQAEQLGIGTEINL